MIIRSLLLFIALILITIQGTVYAKPVSCKNLNQEIQNSFKYKSEILEFFSTPEGMRLMHNIKYSDITPHTYNNERSFLDLVFRFGTGIKNRSDVEIILNNFYSKLFAMVYKEADPYKVLQKFFNFMYVLSDAQINQIVTNDFMHMYNPDISNLKKIVSDHGYSLSDL